MVDAFSLGQLAEQRDMFVNNHRSGVWDAQGEVMALLARREYRQVLNVLQDQWGKKELFAKLCASRGIEPILDLLGEETRNPVSGTAQATGVRRAWEWYAAGASVER